MVKITDDTKITFEILDEILGENPMTVALATQLNRCVFVRGARKVFEKLTAEEGLTQCDCGSWIEENSWDDHSCYYRRSETACAEYYEI